MNYLNKNLLLMYTKCKEYKVQQSDFEMQNVAFLIWKVFYTHFTLLSVTSPDTKPCKAMTK